MSEPTASCATRINQGIPRYIVDGHEFPDDESSLLGGGQFPPFVVFDVDKQENLPGEFASRDEAQQSADAWNAEDAMPFDNDTFHDYVASHGFGAPLPAAFTLGRKLMAEGDDYATAAAEVVARGLTADPEN